MKNQSGHLLLLPPYHSLLNYLSHHSPTSIKFTPPLFFSFVVYSYAFLLPTSTSEITERERERERARPEPTIFEDGLAGSERSILGATTGGCSLSHEKFAC